MIICVKIVVKKTLACNFITFWVMYSFFFPWVYMEALDSTTSTPWASCQIRKIAVCACAGNAGNVFPAAAVYRSRHASRHMCHALPSCMPSSLTSGFIWSRWWENCSRHPQRMRNPRFCISGKRPIGDKFCNLRISLLNLWILLYNVGNTYNRPWKY